jgi:flagellar biosynthesis/type III secretory pathway chaperone
MTNVDQLADVLRTEIQLARELLEAALQQQQAILSFQADGLRQAVVNEEGLIEPLMDVEHQRAQLAQDIVIKTPALKGVPGANQVKLSDIISQINKDESARIGDLGARLRDVVEQVRTVNQQNKTLLEHSLQFIRGTIRLVTDNYSRSLVDQKI